MEVELESEKLVLCILPGPFQSGLGNPDPSWSQYLTWPKSIFLVASLRMLKSTSLQTWFEVVVVDCGSWVDVEGGVDDVVAGDGVDVVDNTLQSVEPAIQSNLSPHDSIVSQVENNRHSLWKSWLSSLDE